MTRSESITDTFAAIGFAVCGVVAGLLIAAVLIWVAREISDPRPCLPSNNRVTAHVDRGAR